MIVCSTASTGSGPRSERARTVCSTGTKYVCAERTLGRDPQHPRAERGQQPADRDLGRRPHPRRVHHIQVGLHPPDGIGPLLTTSARRGLMPDPDPEDDAVTERQRASSPRPPSPPDGGATFAMPEQTVMRSVEDRSSERCAKIFPRGPALGDPEGGIPQALDVGRRPTDRHGRDGVEREGPDTHAPESRAERGVFLRHRGTYPTRARIGLPAMSSARTVIAELRSQADPSRKPGMARWGSTSRTRSA